MSTERQIQASRANGAKSHGPVTAQGKANSSRNANKHGMLSRTIVLKDESMDSFLALLSNLFEEFQPRTPFEESIIEDMAAARWRRLRVWAMEKAGIDREISRQAETSDSSASLDSAAHASLAFHTLGDDSRFLDLINRYDSRYEREYLRAHRRFVEVRDRRTPPIEPPSPPAEKRQFAKRTPEVLENKTTDPQVQPDELDQNKDFAPSVLVHSWPDFFLNNPVLRGAIGLPIDPLGSPPV